METKSFLMKFFNYITNKNYLIFKQLIFYFLILSGVTIDLEEVKSGSCNANPSTTYETWFWLEGIDDNTSFEQAVGNCDKTP